MAEKSLNLYLDGFPAIFPILEDRQDTTPQSRLERIVTLPVGERPTVLVSIDSPEPHIRVLWGNQFITPYFARPGRSSPLQGVSDWYSYQPQF